MHYFTIGAHDVFVNLQVLTVVNCIVRVLAGASSTAADSGYRFDFLGELRDL